MAEENPSYSGNPQSSITNKTTITLSLSSLSGLGVSICGAIWLGIRLWVGSIDSDFQSVRVIASAEEAARIQNDARHDAKLHELESKLAEYAERHRSYDAAFDATWRKFERLEDRILSGNNGGGKRER